MPSTATPTLSPAARRASLLARLIAAAILGQTLFFKLTAAPESVFIFETLGVEPWGRLLTAALELLAVVLLLLPATAALGGALGAGLMTGAIASHLLRLGIEVQGDGGLLFALAVVTLLASLLVTVLRRHELPLAGPLLASRRPQSPART